jgi:pyruvate/2-oxoglutarate dehydrogenase complex dihydrolipoamide acyltransferase (E2) component
MSGLRRAISRTLGEAWRTVPHVIDYREVDVGELMATRRRLKADALARGDEQLAASLSLMPLLVKIASVALQRHPLVNASLSADEQQIVLHDRTHVGLATATDDGLMVPVLRDVQDKSVQQLAHEASAVIARARARRATQQDLAGATFTVNNYGPLGIWLGTPIVTPPQLANLGIGRMEQRAVVREGEIVVRPIVALACSGDHRVLDGDTLAAFVSTVAGLIERPDLLLSELR